MTPASSLNVLIVGINYAPEHAGIAPYTTAAAEHLAELGHSVDVFAGVPHYPSWTVPPEYRWRLQRTALSAGVRVHRFRHFVPRRQDALRRAAYELSFAAQVEARGHKVKPDVVIAVVPTLFSALAAARIARRTGARLVVWLQDLMSAAATQSGMPGGRSVSNEVLKLEERVIRQADAVVVVSDAFRRFAEQAGAAPESVVTIGNWTHLEVSTSPRAAMRRQQEWGDDEVIVLHTGNMGLKQGLTRVVEAAGLAARTFTSARFVLMGDGSQRSKLEAEAQGLGNVAVVDPVDGAAYSDVLAAADVLLLNERQGVTNMSLPSKLTSYLASGRPIVAAVDQHGSTAVEIRRSGGGLVTAEQTAESIVSSVRELTENQGLATSLGAQGQRYAYAVLSAESSLARLAELVSGSTTRRVPA